MRKQRARKNQKIPPQKKRENVKEKKEKVRGRLHLEVPKKIRSHIRRFKRTHIHPIRLFASLNVALSRHQKKSLQIQFSSSKWGWGLKILSSIIITDIFTMSLPVFAWRMVTLMLFRARECKIAFSPIKCPDSVHSTFKFDWNRTWMFQLL